MSLLFFLFEVVVISLSGVMMPGPVTAAAVAMGTRSRYAGTLIAVGHGIIEFPLMILIMLGMDKLLKSTNAKIIIGLAGGVFLLIMAIQMLRNLRSAEKEQAKVTKSAPVLAGLILSAGNPYFLLWWATIGLTLATTASQFGVWAFALFAVVHWLCDFVWLGALSWASFKGSGLLSPRRQRTLLLICSLALLVFGVVFIYTAGSTLINLILAKSH
ncbi:hypothetical protein ES703_83407 [subsurface metagenome]